MDKILPKLHEGARFGRLVIAYRTEMSKRSKWWVVCDCGNEKEVWGSALLSKHTQSCGCLRREVVTKKNYKHGKSKDPLYSVWNSMWQRCTNPNDPAFHNYGFRGITICQRWKSFEHFADDVGTPPSKLHSLDRIDNTKGYFPKNVRWVTRKEQNRNTRRNIYITYRGRSQCLKDWANELGISYYTIIDRVFIQQLSIEDAFNKPIGRWANNESKKSP